MTKNLRKVRRILVIMTAYTPNTGKLRSRRIRSIHAAKFVTTPNCHCHVYSRQQTAGEVYLRKGKFLFSAVTNHQDSSKRFTLYFWQTCSIKHHFSYFAKHPALLQLLREGYSRTQISTTIYSQVLIHTAEWTGAMSSENTCPMFYTAQHRIRARVLSVESSKLFPWAIQ